MNKWKALIKASSREKNANSKGIQWFQLMKFFSLLLLLLLCWWNGPEKRCIEMEINKTTLSVYFYSTRLFGFAPYSIEQNKLNQIIQVKYSRFLCIYSVALLILLAALTNYGLYFDATSPIPIRWVSFVSKVNIDSEFNRFSLITKWIINWINIAYCSRGRIDWKIQHQELSRDLM